MGRRLVAILITVGLLLGASGMAVAESQDDVLRRGAYGNPLRIFAFFIYPAGVIVDTFAVRPLTFMACFASGLTGCTPEEQRALGIEAAVEEQEAQARQARALESIELRRE
jgi:hypothetical protein